MASKKKQAGGAEKVDVQEALAALAGELRKKGSARLPGVGKLSIRDTKTRKGLKRRVVLNVDQDFQTSIERGVAPEDATARALVEALGEGETLRIAGLGSFAIEDQPATTNVHPRTRKTVVVPARRVLVFSGATLGK